MSRLLYLQSGGPTAVLNTSAQGVITAARARGRDICAARHGLAGLLAGQLYDLAALPAAQLARLGETPGACFGTSRLTLSLREQDPAQWQTLAQLMRRFDIGSVLLNGGNGSMQTALALQQLALDFALPLTVIGIPKTIDNDLRATDFSPGFPSAARYLATALREVMADLRSMDTPRVFIMETMGRHVGWLAAACAAAGGQGYPAPLLLLPEVALALPAVLQAVQTALVRDGFCAIVVAEGLRDAQGHFVAQQQHSGIYGHERLGGAGMWLAAALQQHTGLSAHVAVPDCLQRTARHWVAAADLAMAYEVGRTAVAWACAGMDGVMVALQRDDAGWQCRPVALAAVADLERALPAAMIDSSGLGVTPAFLDYLLPLLGELPLPSTPGDPLPLLA